MLFMLLFRAAHTPQEMSEQSLALVIYLIDLGVSLALQQSVSQSGNVTMIFYHHTTTSAEFVPSAQGFMLISLRNWVEMDPNRVRKNCSDT